MHFNPKAMSGPLYCCIPPAPPAPPAMKAGVAVASGTRSSAFHGDARDKRRVPGAERAQRGVPPSPGRTEGTARSPWATPLRLARTVTLCQPRSFLRRLPRLWRQPQREPGPGVSTALPVSCRFAGSSSSASETQRATWQPLCRGSKCHVHSFLYCEA